MSRSAIKATVFVPLDSCSCCYDDVPDRFTKIVMPFKQHVELAIKNGAGLEGNKHDFIANTVMAENGHKFTKLADFQRYLEMTFYTHQISRIIKKKPR
ncbi:MAG: hypothetical protein Q6373_013975 [Candidatus Sigynarchaeota archaeon]